MAKKKNGLQAQTKSTDVNIPVQSNTESGDNFISVMSKFPHDLSFILPNGKIKIIKGMPQNKLVVANSQGMTMPFGSYAKTELTAEEWSFFANLHRDQPFIKNKIIFAETNEKRAASAVKELDEEVKSGMEQIDPTEVPGIKTSTDAKAMSDN